MVLQVARAGPVQPVLEVVGAELASIPSARSVTALPEAVQVLWLVARQEPEQVVLAVLALRPMTTVKQGLQAEAVRRIQPVSVAQEERVYEVEVEVEVARRLVATAAPGVMVEVAMW